MVHIDTGLEECQFQLSFFHDDIFSLLIWAKIWLEGLNISLIPKNSTHLVHLSENKPEILTSLCKLSVSMTRVHCLHPHRTDCLWTRIQKIIKDQQTPCMVHHTDLFLNIYLSWTHGRRLLLFFFLKSNKLKWLKMKNDWMY